MLEKPLAADLSTAVKLYDAVQKSDKKLVPGLCLRLNPLFMLATPRVKGLGKTNYAYSMALGNAAGPLGPQEGVSTRSSSGGR